MLTHYVNLTTKTITTLQCFIIVYLIKQHELEIKTIVQILFIYLFTFIEVFCFIFYFIIYYFLNTLFLLIHIAIFLVICTSLTHFFFLCSLSAVNWCEKTFNPKGFKLNLISLFFVLFEINPQTGLDCVSIFRGNISLAPALNP